MNQGESQGERSVLGRRRFLTGAAATAAVVTVGCSGSDGKSGTAGDATTTTTTRQGFTTTTTHTAKLDADPFRLGVASGDPLPDRVVLWTRLAPDPIAANGAGGMASSPVDVVWEIASDERFTKIAAAGVATAEAAHGHSVHVDAADLTPATGYFYRFRVGEWSSPVGRTRTLPDGKTDRFRLAVANCQMFETGQYAAYRAMVEEDFDLVVHLGDYIYEYAALPGERTVAPAGPIATLADYRLRHASYRLDKHLAAAHARFPFVVTWDDHDVANNYMGDHVPGLDDAGAKERKAVAYQAFWEHLPLRLDPPDGPDLTLHRALTIGDLARLHMLDERQDAALPPCRSNPDDTMDFGNCDAREGEDRTRLGTAQEKWLDGSLAEGGVTWNLLGNPVVLAPVDAGSVDPAYYLDSWDGFPQARQRLVDRLAEADNPVVLTGDYHQGMVLDVHQTPADLATPVVAPEFMAPPISSGLFGADVTARNPHIREQLNNHGYLGVEVTPDRLTAQFHTVDNVTKADSPVTLASTWVVDAGDPVTRRA